MCTKSLPNHCPVRAAIHIRDRAIRLGVPPKLPLAVFKNTQGCSQYIDDFHLTQILQYLAKTVFNISQTTDLAGFTCHSIRVGACVYSFMRQVKLQTLLKRDFAGVLTLIKCILERPRSQHLCILKQSMHLIIKLSFHYQARFFRRVNNQISFSSFLSGFPCPLFPLQWAPA